MKKLFYLMATYLLLCGCSHSSKSTSKVNDPDSIKQQDETLQTSSSKSDTLRVPDLGDASFMMNNKRGRLYSAYSGSGVFRYLANTNGDWRYMWGVDEITNQNDSICIEMGIERFLLDKDVEFSNIDKIYNPFPDIMQWYSKEYTIQRKGETYARLCMEMTYPKSSLQGSWKLRNWISSVLNLEMSNTDNDNSSYNDDYNNPEKMLNHYYNIYKHNYAEENPINDPKLWLYWDEHILISLRWMSPNKKLLTFYIATDSYAGGAHGYFTRQYVTIDLKHQKELRFEDYIKTEKRRKVRQLLLHKMKADFGRDGTDAEYLACLFDEEQLKTKFPDLKSQEAYSYMMDNFIIYEPALTPQGLVFYYNPYDIDCFAGGNKLFILTYDELKGCMKSDYKMINK